ncbi:GNAT family N-acetyltransferase [Mycoplasmatota bacterium zrk1]
MDLITERLTLRSFQEHDLDFFLGLEQNDFYIKYERDTIPSDEEIKEKFDGILINLESDKYSRFLITGSDGKQMGTVVLWRINEKINEWEIGWGILQKFTGLGYVTEAARRVIQFAFETLKIHRVVALCHANNTPSENIMKRIGMQKEGTFRDNRFLNGKWRDSLQYSITEDEYYQMKSK